MRYMIYPLNQPWVMGIQQIELIGKLNRLIFAEEWVVKY